MQANCLGFIENNQWPTNSPHSNPLNYHVWSAMLEKYHNSTEAGQDD